MSRPRALAPSFALGALVRPARLAAALTIAAIAVPGCLKVPPEDAENPDGAAAPQSAEALLARYIDAIGGEQALRAITDRTVESRIVINPEEGCDENDEECQKTEQTGSFILQTTAKGQLYRNTRVNKAVEERGYDGKEGWSLQSGVIVLDDEQALAASREDATLHWYFDLKARGITLALEKPRDRDHAGKPALLDGLRWQSDNQSIPEKTMWFDRDTGLLREELVEEPAEGDEVLQQWVIYEDYQAVDGVKLPHRIRLLSVLGDRSQEVVFTTQRVSHAKIDPGVFARPVLPAPKPAPDKLLSDLAEARTAVEEDPKDTGALVVLARAAWAAAHFDEAEKAAQAALKIDPKESEALWIAARVKIMSGDSKGGAALLDRAAKVGLRPELVGQQRAWIGSHTRDYAAVARAVAATGPDNAALAQLYRTFAGKPLVVAMGGDGCTTTVPLLNAGTTLPLVEVEIAGEKIKAMIDTGAADVILDEDFAEKIKVPIRSYTPIGRQGDEIGHGQLAELKLGDATVKNVPVDIFESKTIAAMSGTDGSETRAVLGTRFLEVFQITLDPGAETFTAVNRGSSKCKKAMGAQRTGQSAPFWLHETHFLYVMATMNGAEGFFLINTGMQGVDLAANTKAFRRSAIGAPALRRGQPSLVDVDALTIGGHTSTGLRAAYGYFEQEKSTDEFRLDGMLGMGALRGARWTLDFDEQRIYLAPAGKAAAQPAEAGAAKPAEKAAAKPAAKAAAKPAEKAAAGADK